jgi:hypothetical protein
MPLGEFKPPQEGPKIGKEGAVGDLPPHKQEAIGDFAKELADRGLDKPTATDPAPPSVDAPELSAEAEDTVQRGIDTLAALQRVHEQEGTQEDLPDPIEEAAEPTEEDKQEFLRAMFGNKPYKKVFKLFGCNTITLQDVTPAQEEELYSQLANAKIPQGNDWAVTLDRLRLVAYNRSYNWDGHKKKLPDDIMPSAEIADELINMLPSATVYSAMMRCARIFRRHLEIIVERSIASDFWTVDGSSSLPEPLPEEPSTTEKNPGAAAGS